MAGPDDDLVAEKTEGYKVGDKKTIAEYTNLGRWAVHLRDSRTSHELCAKDHSITKQAFNVEVLGLDVSVMSAYVQT